MTSDQTRLALLLTHEQWMVDQVAYDLAGGRATARQCAETARLLERAARQLREHGAALSFGGGLTGGVIDAGVIDTGLPGGRDGDPW
ncbi:hypothetical protein [Actinopolyspora mortivallis]|uniref:Uncharacterized protein n=1 Tax=Actinopolyspora mortivallis TaxID=33906 RepID=A0A2T0H0C5_ACTMO|nr:hypothetical protein [Actinopolyspora mortivallis]PRW64733.1 hypothetical protein CEP50_02525 [Actinopolyspora mortivallis]